MHKSITVYVNRPKNQNPNSISISEKDKIVNGSCDNIMFSELESLPISDIYSSIDMLLEKTRIKTGKLFLSFIDFDQLINDIFYEKISIEEYNKIVYNNPKNVNLVTEKYILEYLRQNESYTINSTTYDGYVIRMEIQRNG